MSDSLSPSPALSFLERSLALGTVRLRLAEILGGLSVVVGLGGINAATTLGADSALAPFSAQEAGQTVPFLARVVLLLLVAVRPTTSKAPPILAGALFVASVAFRVVTLPDLLVCAGLVWYASRERRADDRPLSKAIAGVAVVLTVACLIPRPAAAATPEPSDPAAAYDYWMTRKNPRRAHASAIAWAKTEPTPRAGYLALAKIDLALGDTEKARKVLRKIIERTDADDVRAKATALEAELGDGH